jgi:KaiC/GvpD/RAD55 family RecA-like ATPase
MLDIDAIKAACRGRWLDVLSRLCGVLPDLLDGKNHPCPKCGGTDRFRMIDADDGALFCNQCFKTGNGDGIAAVMWLTGANFPQAAEMIGSHVGVTAKAEAVNVVEEMAWRKGVSAESLRAFGAAEAQRGKLTVCRIPMYDADMNRVGNFDMSPISDDFIKGKTEHGCRLGMFVSVQPLPGDLVLVVEGVKDAAALCCIDAVAVGLPTCRMDASFARLFRDTHAIIIPDRDKAGIDGANETAARLYGVAASVKIAELPAEYKESGGADVRDVLRQRDGLKKVDDAIRHAKPWHPVENSKPKFMSLADGVVEYIQRLSQKQLLITTSLPGVDDALSGGVMEGEMVIIAGRPSHGKTMAALQALDWMAKERPCLLISEEMPMAALSERALSSISDIPEPTWKDSQDRLMNQAVPHYARRQPIMVIESCMTVQAAITSVEEAIEQYGIKVLCVDYVQRLRGEGGSEYEWVSDASKKLKQVAMRNNLIFLALCQLNRGVEQRNTSSPRMSDLRASGQLEQDADVILFVEYLHRTDPSKHTDEEFRIMVAKNRNRKTHKTLIDCKFDTSRQRLLAISDRTPDVTIMPNYNPQWD